MINPLQDKQKLWLTLSVPYSAETKEAIGNFLFELGCNGLLEEKNSFVAYYSPLHDFEKLKHSIINYVKSLNSLGIPVAIPRIKYQEIAHEDWNAEWKKRYEPIFIKNKLMIKPSWLSLPPHPPPFIIEIDPQMAFGTGTHSTTKLLLEIIADTIKGGETIMDIGTGTGILTIAAAKLGARDIIAFDIDPIATATAQANIHKNNIQNKVKLFTGTLETLKKRAFSVIFSNINRIETLKILPFIPEFLDYRSKFFVSGILVEEEKLLKQELDRARLHVYATVQDEEWIVLQTEKIP